jgi:hypothetical protein
MRTEHRKHPPAHDSAALIGIHEGRPFSRRKSLIRSTPRSSIVVLFFVYSFGTFLVQHSISGISADELQSLIIDFDSAPLRIKTNMLHKSGQSNTLDRLESVPMQAENYQGEPSHKSAKGQSLPKQAERPRILTLWESENLPQWMQGGSFLTSSRCFEEKSNNHRCRFADYFCGMPNRGVF